MGSRSRRASQGRFAAAFGRCGRRATRRSAGVTAWLVLVVVVAFVAPSSSYGDTGTPDWYGHGHRTDAAGDLVVRVLKGSTASRSPSGHSGSSCPAEPSVSGNVQVNCLAEDGASPSNTQSETTVAAFGSKVVVGYNDSLVCCVPATNLAGYSVSTDGGATFADEGDLPFEPDVQPIGDPTVAHDAAGNFYFASLALGSAGRGTHSLLSFYEMPAGTDTFQLVSVPVDVGSSQRFFADKEYLAVGADAAGNTHFYLTWTLFSRASGSPIMLTDSTDGVHWRTTTVSTSSACAQGSNPVPAGGRLYVSWLEVLPSLCSSATGTAAVETMATVDVASASVTAITTIADVNGAGDKLVACNGPSDLREVIETQPGHDARLIPMPTTTIDPAGVLYAAWMDRPDGDGGANTNATRILLSYSLDGNTTWSPPQVISGTLSRRIMSDRFDPWITADASGVHAMWYERVAGPAADQIQTDKEDLSLATARSAPTGAGETAISSVSFPIIQTNPNQDPVIANCYMGEYNRIVSTGSTRYVTWGDNRNVVTISGGGAENQPDVFLQSY